MGTFQQYRCLDGMCGAIDCYECGVPGYYECRECGKAGQNLASSYVGEIDLCEECTMVEKMHDDLMSDKALRDREEHEFLAGVVCMFMVCMFAECVYPWWDRLELAISGRYLETDASRCPRVEFDGEEVMNAIAWVTTEDRAPGGTKRYRVDVDTIYEGIWRITNGYAQVDEKIRKAIIQADRDNGVCNLDVNDADCIVQAAIFGEVVYG